MVPFEEGPRDENDDSADGLGAARGCANALAYTFVAACMMAICYMLYKLWTTT